MLPDIKTVNEAFNAYTSTDLNKSSPARQLLFEFANYCIENIYVDNDTSQVVQSRQAMTSWWLTHGNVGFDHSPPLRWQIAYEAARKFATEIDHNTIIHSGETLDEILPRIVFVIKNLAITQDCHQYFVKLKSRTINFNVKECYRKLSLARKLLYQASTSATQVVSHSLRVYAMLNAASHAHSPTASQHHYFVRRIRISHLHQRQIQRQHQHLH
jgi:hypothetical protein